MGTSKSKVEVSELRSPLKKDVDDLAAKLQDIKKREKEVREERCGVTIAKEEVKNCIAGLQSKKHGLWLHRKTMILALCDRDADEIYRFTRSPQSEAEDLLLDFLCSKVEWQLVLIDEMFRRKHKVQIAEYLKKNHFDVDLVEIIDHMEGQDENLKQLCKYRLLDPIERDALLLSEYTNKNICDDRNIIEIITTRKYHHLQKVLLLFKQKFGKSFHERISTKTNFINNAHYYHFIVSILDSNQHEQSITLDPSLCERYVKELIQACPNNASITTKRMSQFSSLNHQKSGPQTQQLQGHHRKSQSAHSYIPASTIASLDRAGTPTSLHTTTPNTPFFNDGPTTSTSGTMGATDVETVLRILCSINLKQFETLNDSFPGNNLLEVLEHSVHGDLKNAIVARFTPRLTYLAQRVKAVISKEDASVHVSRWAYFTHISFRPLFIY